MADFGYLVIETNGINNGTFVIAGFNTTILAERLMEQLNKESKPSEITYSVVKNTLAYQAGIN